MLVERPFYAMEVEVKRDMDKVRELLLSIESGEEASIRTRYDAEDGHHLRLLQDAGFIDSDMDELPLQYAGGEESWLGLRLTWEGSNYLDQVRDSSRWGKIKKTIAEKGEPLTIATVKACATMLVKGVFG